MSHYDCSALSNTAFVRLHYIDNICNELRNLCNIFFISILESWAEEWNF